MWDKYHLLIKWLACVRTWTAGRYYTRARVSTLTGLVERRSYIQHRCGDPREDVHLRITMAFLSRNRIAYVCLNKEKEKRGRVFMRKMHITINLSLPAIARSVMIRNLDPEHHIMHARSQHVQFGIWVAIHIWCLVISYITQWFGNRRKYAWNLKGYFMYTHTMRIPMYLSTWVAQA